ncbi:GNAT family N-acetyltransferase [Egbenema bharatensis]|uniref:GNAT family N-acetyltransferase n=1 Tax=Egbenema bharatensis TaxID=3463334 RepID=UPI003A873B9C
MQRPDLPSSSSDARSPLPPITSGWESETANSVLLVRTVRHQDLQSIADVLASSFHSPEGLLGWLYPLLRIGIYEDLRSRLYSQTHHYACLVAILRNTDESLAVEQLDRPVGTVEISVRSRSLNPFLQSRYPYLSNLAVLTECRRKGVALQLLHTCERIVLDWGFQEIYLHVLENNHRARRLYWKAGYRLKAININPIGFVLGRPRQLLLYKRLAK